jgi:hypothetical protein
MSAACHTLVIESYRKNRHNYRLLFGAPVRIVRHGWRRQMVVFQAGQVFGYERWRANRFGTQTWSITVCCATDGPRLTRVPGVIPGGEIWLHAAGKTRVKRVFAALDSLKQNGLSPEYMPVRRWRELAQMLATGGDLIDCVRSWSC